MEPRESKLRPIPAQFPKSFTKPDEPWHHYLTLDLIVYVLSYTLFHPWTCWILVLCLRAQYTPYGNIEMRIAMAWAMLMSGIGIFGIFSDRFAYGRPREVDLSEEVIVITGGVEGLGGLLADTYGMRHANVAVLDTKKVSDEESEERGVLFYQCDVGDAEQVERVAREIVEDLGPPTILINNAGIVRPKSILDTTASDVEQVFRTNTLSHFHTLRTFLPHMLESRRGTIVTISSVLGHLGAAHLSSYAASKAALHALHHSLRAELAQHPHGADIKTILVSPGQMSTKMFEGVKTPSNFLAPVIAPTDVAKEILRLVERGESGEVVMPLYARWISVFGVLPAGVQKVVRRLSGVDTAIQRAGLVKEKMVAAEKSG
ncbi:NAD(P)-binding protein [Westerdykella ornata]|uniref:Short-chain dehydrogenase/reductase 3 n=1 Tax=Westerdykella ornata TaxID=318751 RepID=A0A6A6JND3_WESOR|nr:NAD(P)-binding protein [Westerdykella ornata]KAF2277166.1 NAD(P)-binding protein [Westerdykella ornata]